MPDKNSTLHTIKRNSLSSRWGVWATGTDEGSPVEKLLVEFKNSEDAEAYRDRIEAGEVHEAVIVSLSEKKPSANGGGGIFGKLFRRGTTADVIDGTAAPVVHNQVIEIQAPIKKEADESPVDGEVPASVKAAAVPESPSRYQVIEQPVPEPVQVAPEAPVVAAVPEPDAATQVEESIVVAEVQQPEMETVPDPVPELIEPAPVEQPAVVNVVAPEETVTEVAKAPETEQVAPRPEVGPVAPAEPTKVVAEDEQVAAVEAPAPIAKTEAPEPAPAPVAKAEAPVPTPAPVAPVANVLEQDSSRDDGLLVDWTFTPPPDVTPEEVRSSGGAIVDPAPLANEAQVDNTVDPEWAAPTKKPAAARPEAVPAISEDPGTGRITVDVCVSKALKDSAAGDPRVSDKKYNSIASKEYTEVSKAFSAGNSPTHLRDELTHLAAVCLAWAEAIDKRQDKETGSIAA